MVHAQFVGEADVVGLQLLGAVVVRVREHHGGEGLARGRVGLVVDAGDAGAKRCEQESGDTRSAEARKKMGRSPAQQCREWHVQQGKVDLTCCTSIEWSTMLLRSPWASAEPSRPVYFCEQGEQGRGV